MKKYKIIVFDMDGTLYDLEDVMAMNYKTQCDFLIEKEKLSENDVGTLFASNHIYPEMRKDSRSCTEFLSGEVLIRRNGTDLEKIILMRVAY